MSDGAWYVASDLFIKTHGRGRPRLNDRLMLDGVLWGLCSGAASRDIMDMQPDSKCKNAPSQYGRHQPGTSDHSVIFAALSCPQWVAPSTSSVVSDPSIKDCQG
ncbi:hypothetical protein DMW99_17045 [Pseudomonas chlororaphis]|nr:hypothetical protein DMW99_17045 [Pseudomonas chlororaphis]